MYYTSYRKCYNKKQKLLSSLEELSKEVVGCFFFVVAQWIKYIAAVLLKLSLSHHCYGEKTIEIKEHIIIGNNFVIKKLHLPSAR